MNEKNTYMNCDCFFAAANGYNGFKSYFKEVFNPQAFEKIYILKGGPGTGKSSLMKKILNSISDKATVQAILCSSDINSLDGLIIDSGNKKIAILDGTSPHATDPIYPGAVEEIINLGNAWNGNLLTNNRENIMNLSNHKTFQYKNAYDYLKICGAVNNIIQSELGTLTEKADELVKSVLSQVNSKGKAKTELISSFGKNGFGYIDTFERKASVIYKVVGIYGSEYHFMNAIKSAAESRKLCYTVAPSPLTDEHCDAIYFEKERIAMIAGNRASESKSIIIDTAKLLDQKNISEKKNKLEFLWKEHETLLWSAADSFTMASEAHFALEKIYSASMDFSYNNEIFDKLLNDIYTLFDIENRNTDTTIN